MGRMADVLVGAKQQAEKIILERLNGYNCAKQYVAMGTLLANLSRKKEELVVLKRHVMEVSGGVINMYTCDCINGSLHHQYRSCKNRKISCLNRSIVPFCLMSSHI